MKKAKVVAKAKGPPRVAQRWLETTPAQGKAKATKVDQKGKENIPNLILAIEPPTPAATVGSLDTKIANAEKDKYNEKDNEEIPHAL